MSKENPRSHSGLRAWPGRSSPHPPGESTQKRTIIITKYYYLLSSEYSDCLTGYWEELATPPRWEYTEQNYNNHYINITICWVASTVTAWLGIVVFLSTVNGCYCWGEWLGTPMEIKVIFFILFKCDYSDGVLLWVLNGKELSWVSIGSCTLSSKKLPQFGDYNKLLSTVW